MISSTAAAITADAIQQQRERQLQQQQELVEQQKLFARTQGADRQSPTASQLGSRQPTFARDFSLGRGDGVNRLPMGGRNGPTGSMLRASGSDVQQLSQLVEERAVSHSQAGPRQGPESRMSMAKAAAAGGSLSPIGQLVDIILFLTKDKSGATPRIMRKLANEALVEPDMPRSGSTSGLPAEVVRSTAQDASHKATPLALASADVDEIKRSLARSTAPKPGRMEQLVPKVFTFDLFEDNPQWAEFITSRVGERYVQYVAKYHKAMDYKEYLEAKQAGRTTAQPPPEPVPLYWRWWYSPYRMWTYFTLSHPDFTGELDPDPELLAQEREAEQQRLYEAMNSHNSSLHSTHTSLSMSGGSAGLAAAGPAGSPGGLPLSRTASGSSAGGGGGGDARGRGQGQTVKGCFASGWLRQCHLAYWTSLFLIVVILLNTATFCVESIPHYEGTPVEDALTLVDYVCMGIFTVEYVARLLTTPVLGPFFTSFSNFIDLVAIAPFYLELMITGSSTEAAQTRIVRLLRLLRVVRMVKAIPRIRHLSLVVDTISSSADILVMLVFLLVVLLVLFGTVFYFVEPDTFDSIPQGIYYSQTTLTTTGYGDLYPVTPWGRFLAGIMMLMCMAIVSLPIAVLGGNFSTRWEQFKGFTSANSRSHQVWPKFLKLQRGLQKYSTAMDKIIEQLHRSEGSLEVDIAEVRRHMGEAFAALARAKQQQQHGGPSAPGSRDPSVTQRRSSTSFAGRSIASVAAMASAAAKMGRQGAGAGAGVVRQASEGSGALDRRTSEASVEEGSVRAGREGSLYSLAEAEEAAPREEEAAQGACFAAVAVRERSELPQGPEGGSGGRLQGAVLQAIRATREGGGHGAGGAGSTSGPRPVGEGTEQGEGGSGDAAAAADASGTVSSGTRAAAAVDADAGAGAGGDPGAEAADPYAVPSVFMDSDAQLTPMAAHVPQVPMHTLPAAPAAAPSPAAASPSPPPERIRIRSAASVPDGALARPRAVSHDEVSPFVTSVTEPPQTGTMTISINRQSVASNASVASRGSGGGSKLRRFLPGKLGGGSSMGPSRLGLPLVGSAWKGSGAAGSGQAAGAGGVVDKGEVAVAAAAAAKASEALQRARDALTEHSTLAAVAMILQSGGLPEKLEQLDQQHRFLRCWTAELGPLADDMDELRGALDKLLAAVKEPATTASATPGAEGQQQGQEEAAAAEEGQQAGGAGKGLEAGGLR